MLCILKDEKYYKKSLQPSNRQGWEFSEVGGRKSDSSREYSLLVNLALSHLLSLKFQK